MEEQSMWLAVLLGLNSTLMIFGKSVETVFRNQFNFHLRSPLSLPENDVLKQDQLHLYSCQFSHESQRNALLGSPFQRFLPYLVEPLAVWVLNILIYLRKGKQRISLCVKFFFFTNTFRKS